MPAYKNFIKWLEQFSMIPLVMLISIPHFYEVLAHNGEFFIVPLVIAFFVDLLHYRTVLKASHTGIFSWWSLVALVTTIAAFGFQWRFYDTELVIAYRLLDASIVPFGIVIMAWLQADGFAQTVEEIAKKQNETLRNELEKLRETLKRAGNKVGKLETELKANETILQTQGNKMKRLQASLKDAERVMKAWDIINPLARDIVLMKAGLLETTQTELVTKHNVNKTAVSRLSKSLNGYEKD